MGIKVILNNVSVIMCLGGESWHRLALPQRKAIYVSIKLLRRTLYPKQTYMDTYTPQEFTVAVSPF